MGVPTSVYIAASLGLPYAFAAHINADGVQQDSREKFQSLLNNFDEQLSSAENILLQVLTVEKLGRFE